jgi:hypothetical protein
MLNGEGMKIASQMKAISETSVAIAEAGYGPPSNTGSSAMVSPGPLTARTCSRPLIDVWKMRTFPCAMMCRPEQGSPSENSNSPVLNSFRTVRPAKVFNSSGDKPEKKTRLRKNGGNVNARRGHLGILPIAT